MTSFTFEEASAPQAKEEPTKVPAGKKTFSFEEATGKPSLPKLTSEDAGKYMTTLRGMGEAVAIPAMGVVAKAAGGVASLPALVKGGPEAATAVQEAFDKLVPQPKTEEGKKALEHLGTVVEGAMKAGGAGMAAIEKARASIYGGKPHEAAAETLGRATIEAATYFTPLLGKAPKGAAKPSFGEQLRRADEAAKQKASDEHIDNSFSKEVERMKAEKVPAKKELKPVTYTKQDELPLQSSVEQAKMEQIKDLPQGDLFSPENMERMAVDRYNDITAKEKAALNMKHEQRMAAEEDILRRDEEIERFYTPKAKARERDYVTEFRSIFSSEDMKNKFVQRAVATYGEDYRKAAEAHWDKMNTPTKVATPEGANIGRAVSELSDNLFKLSQMRATDVIQAKQAVESLKPEVFKEASSIDMYESMPEEGSKPLSAEQQKIKETVVQPVLDSMKKTYEDILKETGGEVPEGLSPHTPRIIKESWIKKLESFGENMLGHGGYGRKAGSLRGRSMFAIEMSDGSRQVVNIDGRNVNKFMNGQPVQWDVTDVALKPGMEVEIGGRTGKVVQATTKEIEAQTGLEYSKNLMANALSTDLELKSYLRETKFLKQTMEDLKNIKAAIPAEGPIPTGFKLLDHPTLRNYYIQDRFAEVFQDQILRNTSPARALERINTMAVSSMFWNPFPHLFNAFDHYLNSVNWDLVNPTQWRSIGASMIDAARSVAKLSPEYQEWINSGAGGQYARVASEGFSEGVMKQFHTPDFAEAVKAWGMRPDKFIADWYKTSKKMLWMGSDVFMLAASKHLATKEGVSIMDGKLRQLVETHNPNYRIPSRIGYEGMKESLNWATAGKLPGMAEAVSAAISRNLSLAMQSRTFNIFGRYHYGQFRSLGRGVIDAIKQTEDSPQTRAEALKHLTFAAFNLTVIYPYIWDTLAKAMTGDDTAKQRRSGAATIPQVISDIIFKDEKVLKILGDAYNLPPITAMMAKMGDYKERQNLGLGTVVESVAPAKQISDIATGKRSAKEVLAEQAGIKLKAEEKERRKAKAMKKQERIERRKKRKQKSIRWED